MTHLPLVRVVWKDAWIDTDAFVTIETAHIKHKPMPIETIGWLVVDNESGISIANERSLEDEDSYRGRTYIPRGMIVSIEPFKAVKPRKSKKPAAPETPAPVAE